MLRGLLVATLLALSPGAAGQAPSVLHITVTLPDESGNARPVPRHALLISQNPVSAAPRLIVTGLDGTADVKLHPGSYTVESDRPVALQGKAYQWTRTITVTAGDNVLALTEANADVTDAVPTTASGEPLERDPAFLLPEWQTSVVAIWSPTTRASGFLVDARGLIATTQRVVGSAGSVEIQLGPATKFTGIVVAADKARDVAVVRVDPGVMGSARAVPLSCSGPAQPPIAAGEELLTISAPVHEAKGMTSGTVSRPGATALVSDFLLPRGGVGGPVFTPRGDAVGLTSMEDPSDRTADVRVVPAAEICAVIGPVTDTIAATPPPPPTLLPVEPERAFSIDALKGAVERRAGNLNPYQMSSSAFDIAFITPINTYGAQYTADQMRRRRTTSKDTRAPEPEAVRPLMEFSNWSEYVWEFPPVLLVRVTPKLVEGFWTMVARGAARTQGVAIPPIKRVTSGFSRLRAFCGETEVTPVHPFKLEQRLPDDNVIYEGLYVFAPDALGPSCGTVKLTLYSDKEPEKGDTRVVDPKIVQQVWNDFQAYRDR